MSGACARCSSTVPGGSRFCPSCGAPFTPSSDVPTRLAGPASGAAPGGPPPSPASPPPSRGIHSSPSMARGISSSSSGPHGEARFIPGAQIAGRYRVIGLLGKGGMGEVYRADDLKLGQPVALKFLPEALASDQDRLTRFYNEVRISRQVTHSNVCRVYDIDEYEGQPFLSMEYIDGEDLSSLLKRIGRLPREKAIQIARQVCAGLAAAHDKGILHRDLKPANVLIDGRGHAHITDFGLAGVAHELVGNEVRAGTPAYMAPEQLAGKEVTLRSDIYSLGLTLYELFTGKAAFEATTTQELMKLQSDTTPTSPTQFIEGFDPAVEAVILRCLDKSPAARPASALAVSAALPGGDPLAAALAAGETPSPQMVADAGEEAGFSPALSLGLLGVVVVGLILQIFVVQGTHLVHRMEMPKSPEVLRSEAQGMIRSFGYQVGGEDSAYGFLSDSDALQEIQENDPSPRRWDRVAEIHPAPYRFWYRESPKKLIPANFRGAVSFSDPPLSISGMVNISMEPTGRLVYFKAVPPEREKEPGEEGDGEVKGEQGATPDWPALFQAAGLEMASFSKAEPLWNPDVNCDSQSAWTGAYPDQPDVPIRVEGCGYRGRAAWFHIETPWTEPGRMVAASGDEETPLKKALAYSILTFILALLVGAAFLAWRSLRLGRGDRKGGFRLALYIFLLLVASDLLHLHHVASFGEVVLIFDSLAYDLLMTALVWLLYQGLEPYVRRIWPQVLISWTRLLSGRFRDPMVGRDILAGGTAFTTSLLLGWLTQKATYWLGFPEAALKITPGRALLGGGHALSSWLLTIVNPLIGPLFLTFTLLLLRVILRKQWLAVTVMGVLFTVFIAAASATQLPAGTGNVGLYAVIMTVSSLLDLTVLYLLITRFGYLAFVFLSFFAVCANIFPVTTDFSRFYATTALLAYLPLFAVAFYGFHLARAGRPIFGESMLGDSVLES